MSDVWFSMLTRLSTIGLFACLVTFSARAEEADELPTLLPESLQAMQAGRWEDSRALLEKATALPAAEALSRYGPQFGVAWYRRGICELKLRRWEDAMRSFEICYRDYPNTGGNGGNLYQTKALLKWGEAAVGAEKWETAILRFRKFLEERNKTRDQLDAGPFYVTYAICHYHLGQLLQGNQFLEIAIRNRFTFPTPEDQVVAGLQTLTMAAIRAKDEPALTDFLHRNRADLLWEPDRAAPFIGAYLKLSNDAAAAELWQAALALERLAVDPEIAMEVLRARISAMGSRPGVPDRIGILDKAVLEADLRQLEQDRQAELPLGLLKQVSLARIQEGLGNRAAALMLYERIVLDFPGNPRKENWLVELIRLCRLQHDHDRLDRYGRQLLEAFPNSPHAVEVRSSLFISALSTGNLARQIEYGSAWLTGIKADQPEHTRLLHLLGEAEFRAGHLEAALGWYERSQKEHPQGEFAIADRLQLASINLRLRRWEKAVEHFDALLKTQELPDDTQVQSRFGRGCALMESSVPGASARAAQDFEAVAKNPNSGELQEVARIRWVECLVELKRYEAAEIQARAGIQLPSALLRDRARLLLARAQDLGEKPEEAIESYQLAFEAEDAPLSSGLLAIRRWAELRWSRNRPGDGDRPSDQEAVRLRVRKFLDDSRTKVDSLSPEERLVRSNLEEFVKSPSTGP